MTAREVLLPPSPTDLCRRGTVAEDIVEQAKVLRVAFKALKTVSDKEYGILRDLFWSRIDGLIVAGEPRDTVPAEAPDVQVGGVWYPAAEGERLLASMEDASEEHAGEGGT